MSQQIACPLASALSEILARRLSENPGETWEAVVQPPPATPLPDMAVPAVLSLSGAITGEVYLSLARADLLELGASLQSGSVPDSAADPAAPLLAALTSLADDLRQALSPAHGPVGCRVTTAQAAPAGLERLASISLRSEVGRAATLLLLCPGELLRQLAPAIRPGDHATTSAARGAYGRAAGEPLPIERVIDVPLNVHLRFGQRQLSLQEVLELATGSLVELDRQVEEPVDLILDGRVIARGEVVIVDGNYGMRVTELPPPPFGATQAFGAAQALGAARK